MPAGRPPKPTALHVLNGDPSKNRRYTVEPETKGLPEAPAYLDEVARAEWDSITPLLSDMGLVGSLDGKALANYCEAHSLNRKAKEALTEETLGGDPKRVSQLTRIIRETDQLIKAWLIEFGGTAAARARMRVQPKNKTAASKWQGILKVV